MLFEARESLFFLVQFLVDFAQASLVVQAGGDFAPKNVRLRLQGLDAAPAIIDFRRDSMLADGNASGGGVNEADGLIGQLTPGDVAVREADGGVNGFVEDLDLMVFLEGNHHGAHHADAAGFIGFLNFYHLEAAGERGVFFDVALVFVPGRGGECAESATGQGGFEQVGGIAGARGAARANQRMRFIYEKDDRFGRSLDFVNYPTQTLLKLAFHAGAGLQQTHVQGADGYVFKGRRHIARQDAMNEAFDNGGLAHPGFPGEDRIVLAPAHEDIHALANFLISPDDGIDFTLSGFFGEIGGEAFEGFLLAHFRGGDGPAGLARGGTRAQAGTVAGPQSVLRRAGNNFGEVIGKGLEFDFSQLFRQGEKLVLQLAVEETNDQVSGPDLGIAKHQGRENPGALDDGGDIRGEIGDSSRAARKPVQGGDEVGSQAGAIELEVLENAVQVGVLVLQQLMEPVNGLDVRIAAHLAENRGALDGFVGEAVKFPEKSGSFDFSHSWAR